MRIAYRVQHTAGRDTALQRLLQLLPPEVEVVADHEGDQPNPLRNYLRCLASPFGDATHICVVQDDAVPCKGFATKLKEAVGERPDAVLSLFVGGLPGRTRRDFYAALKSGNRWTPVYFREIHHVVALVWPVLAAQEFLDWFPTARIPGAKNPRSDDAVVGYWARTNKKLFWATVPCLVEHPDDLPSVVQSKNRMGDAGRRAIAFIDDL